MTRKFSFRLLQDRENSLFEVNAAETKTLVVLCHGWHGHLTKTWGELLPLFREGKTCRGCDLLFLGYKKSPSSAHLLASWLSAVLQRVFPTYTHRLGRRVVFTRTYDHLVLVGHSLGTLGLRQALLNLHEGRATSAAATAICERAALVLYAAPLDGVDWKCYMEIIRGKWTELLVRGVNLLVKAREPVADDLAKGSPFLTDLRAASAKVLKDQDSRFPRSHVVLALHDRVIEVRQALDKFLYPSDTHAVLNGHDHCSVCKFSTSLPIHLPPRVAVTRA